MNLISLVSAVLVSAISPIALSPVSGVKEVCAVVVEDQVIVAVLPELFTGYEQKTEALRQAAASLGESLGKDVLLTDDMRTYLILSRIKKRGVDDYERKNLASRLPKIKAYCYAGKKAG